MKQNWVLLACMWLATENLLIRLGVLATLALAWTCVLGFAVVKVVRCLCGLARRLRVLAADLRFGVLSGGFVLETRQLRVQPRPSCSRHEDRAMPKQRRERLA